MVTVLQALYVITLIAIGVILMLRYLKVRNSAYLLFLLAIPLWPLLARPVNLYLGSQIDASPNINEISFPFSLLGETVGEVVISSRAIGGIVRALLLLFAFLLLSRGPESEIEPPNSALQPTGSATG